MLGFKRQNRTNAQMPAPEQTFKQGLGGSVCVCVGRRGAQLSGAQSPFWKSTWVDAACAQGLKASPSSTPWRALTSALTPLRASCSSSGKPRTCRLSPL